MAVARALAVLAVLGLAAASARAQAPEQPLELQTPDELLRTGNAAATAGEWAKVSAAIGAALRVQLAKPQLAEAHRLAGLAYFFQGDRHGAEYHFFEYLKLELDGSLDAALYPPDVIVFFTDVKSKHAATLRALRPKAKRSPVVAVIPLFAQRQNGEPGKGWIIGGSIVALGATHFVTYGLLKSWCDRDQTCDGGDSPTGRDRTSAAAKARVINIASGIGAILAIGYGVYDGVKGYRRRTRELAQPYVSTTSDGAFVGVAGAF